MAIAARAPAQPQIPLDTSFARWVRQHAIPMRPVDEPYRDSAYAFLRPLIGNARLLALGENIHGGHEPLALRNHIIRYAVTQLGFTAVALESGFTEAILVDRYIQGGAGELDSVTHAGISYGFGDLRENRELVQWLRAHNERAPHKVHFYGVDQVGVGDRHYSGAPAVEYALAYLERVAPAAGAEHRARLAPLVERLA
ncbi:MAG TPA: erythromycin esterase family protein, partial [Gemmatimonadaceae bacterium]|nr:erythromycin esterase family protein [Gemmatimonadaceae bacterium]